jgi:hypothetical protein
VQLVVNFQNRQQFSGLIRFFNFLRQYVVVDVQCMLNAPFKDLITRCQMERSTRMSGHCQ